MTTGQQQPSGDRLAWWEEIPLGLALLAQSYVVGLWYFASIAGAAWWVDLIVAVGAGLALDLIVVTTVMGRRAGRSSGWSWGTALGAFGCSALIALDRYGWELRSGLHIAFPLVVFLYSQHLATPRRVSLQETPGATETLKTTQDTALTQSTNSAVPVASGQAFLDELLAVPLEPSRPALAVMSGRRYACPHCGQAVKNKQAVGAAVKNGYCLGCKAERLAA